MSDAQPMSPRATMNEGPDGFEVSVPAPRSVVVIAFLLFWLAGWAAGEAFALTALLGDRVELAAQAFLALWLAFWTLGGLAAVWTVLYQVAGHERLVAASDTLRLRQELFGLGRWRRIRYEDIRELRAMAPTIPAAQPLPPMLRGALRMTGLTGGGLLIRVGENGTPIRFGPLMSHGESVQVAATLRARCPLTALRNPSDDAHHAA